MATATKTWQMYIGGAWVDSSGGEAEPNIDQPAPPGLEKGQEVMASSGCLGCHKVGENGNTLGPNLTDVGDRLGKDAIARTLVNPTPPMPPYRQLQQNNPQQFNQLVEYVASLRDE